MGVTIWLGPMLATSLVLARMLSCLRLVWGFGPRNVGRRGSVGGVGGSYLTSVRFL